MSPVSRACNLSTLFKFSKALFFIQTGSEVRLIDRQLLEQLWPILARKDLELLLVLRDSRELRLGV